MMQISAVPTSALPILNDPQAEKGAEPANSGDFAAVLAAQPGAAVPEAGATAPEALAQVPARLQALTGKPGGKLLPLPAMPAMAFIADGATEGAPELKVDAEKAGLDRQSPDAALPLPQPAPLLIPLAAPVSLTPVAGPSPAAREAQTPDTKNLAQPAGAMAVLQTSHPLPGKVMQQMPPVELDPAPWPTSLPASLPASLPTPLPTPLSPALTVLAQGAPTPFSKTAIEVRLPLLAPAPAATAQAANSAAAPEAALASPATAGEVLQAATGQAAVPNQGQSIRPRPGRAKGDERASLAPSVQPGNPAKAGDETALVAPVQSIAAQPMLAVQQDQVATSPMAAAPSPSGNRIEAPADFSALVDRLVAAREAAQSTLMPGVVHAAVAHAEFGQVSLRFEQQDGALSVAIASADPDFARSALAAAPASQQAADTGDNRGSTGRQDSGQSQYQPQAQAQAQGQSGGQGAQRHPASPPLADAQHRQAAPAAPETLNREGQPPRRRGIFA